MKYSVNLRWLGWMQKYHKLKRREGGDGAVTHWLNQLFLTNPCACLQIRPGNSSLPMYSIPPYNQCSRFELPTFSSSSLLVPHIDVPTLRCWRQLQATYLIGSLSKLHISAEPSTWRSHTWKNWRRTYIRMICEELSIKPSIGSSEATSRSSLSTSQRLFEIKRQGKTNGWTHMKVRIQIWFGDFFATNYGCTCCLCLHSTLSLNGSRMSFHGAAAFCATLSTPPIYLSHPDLVSNQPSAECPLLQIFWKFPIGININICHIMPNK